MIFVDTSIWMYAVGRPHPLRTPARDFFTESLANRDDLAASSEVLQELLHAYLPVDRLAALDAAVALVRGTVREVWPVEEADVHHARGLADDHPDLGARDLLHLAVCRRRGVSEIKTFDRALAAALL